MFGFLMMFVVFGVIVYLAIAKIVPAMMFHYGGAGDRKGRAEYGRIKRELPDSADAKLSEAEFVEKFIQATPGPWRYVFMVFALAILGIPMACVAGLVGVAAGE
jgi:hypothetical protein